MQKAKGILYVGKSREPMQINGIYSRAASKQLLTYVDEDGEKLKFRPKRTEDRGIPVKTIDSRSRAKFELHKKKPILYQKIKRNISKAKTVTEEKKKGKEKKPKKSDDKAGKALKVTAEPAPKKQEKEEKVALESISTKTKKEDVQEEIIRNFVSKKPMSDAELGKMLKEAIANMVTTKAPKKKDKIANIKMDAETIPDEIVTENTKNIDKFEKIIIDEPKKKKEKKKKTKEKTKEKEEEPIKIVSEIQKVINGLKKAGYEAREPVDGWPSQYKKPTKKIPVYYQARKNGTYVDSIKYVDFPKDFRPVETIPERGSLYSKNTYLRYEETTHWVKGYYKKYALEIKADPWE